MEPDTLYRAIESRDRRFEGRFVVAVTSTGIYCRPGCPAKIPLRKNVCFYRHPAAAEAAGFRACARCRPDAVVWNGTSSTVKRALMLIDAGAVGDENVGRLAERLGVGDRHLRRLFASHVGTSPQKVAQTRRAHFARQLIDQTALPLAEIAFAAGFGSVRRFNAAMRRAFDRTPTELRARTRPTGTGTGTGGGGGALTLALPFRGPYAWAPLVAFLAERAIPGVESIVGSGAGAVYRRTTADGGVVSVRAGERALEVMLRVPSARGLRDAVERIRRLFDVAADPLAIGAVLSRDPALRPAIRACPGRRVPGGWDGLEVAIRAILGQQISVARATQLAGKLVAAWGVPLASAYGDGDGALTHRFPDAGVLAEAGGDAIARAVGMPRARGGAIAALARAVADGSLPLDGTLPLETLVERLCALPGIGPWTAHYLGMRLGEPDAFPAGDLWLRRALDTDERGLLARAERWRPFRAYAALHLWQSEQLR
jgi:AraC family transcriptional regulator of adaptative response / DNA-3-methyladenine glycosylase II